ncbi:MAG TPA: hypothetical protein VGS12_17815 [Caulobacteraceae bacterium]|nr:hypothetical protein [Caulobacteraceae bacterium]
MFNDFKILITAAAVLSVAAPGVACAQAAAGQSSYDYAPATPSAANAGVNTSGQIVSGDEVTPAQAQALDQGLDRTTTNGPVPDTPANRARYGGPMSRAGRLTAPAGN